MDIVAEDKRSVAGGMRTVAEDTVVVDGKHPASALMAAADTVPVAAVAGSLRASARVKSLAVGADMEKLTVLSQC